MRVLQIHNYYQLWGGEDEAAQHDVRLLQQYGHEVKQYCRNNDEIKTYGPLRKCRLFFETTWSMKSYKEIRGILKEFKPDIVHMHNFFPLVSPAAYYACASVGVPVIQTLHDFRLICPMSHLLREERICEECIHDSLWRSIRYGCYRGSRLLTLPIALMVSAHRWLKTWEKRVDLYIAVSEFVRGKFIESGFRASKVVVRPNCFAEDPGPGEGRRKYALYVGSLTSGKGIMTLLEAWKNISLPLKIVGDGPLYPWAETFIRKNNLRQVCLEGFLSQKEVFRSLKEALFLVMPPIWFETFGRTIVEAYATATPVLGSRLGAVAELVEEGKTGLLFCPGDPDDLAKKVNYAMENPQEREAWGKEARVVFEKKYRAQISYDRLMEIYQQASRQ
jgi:glycosyltransferase involved in cell wall biosynthesis